MKDNDNYEISLITNHSDNIIFKVYNVTGQSLISRKVSYKEGALDIRCNFKSNRAF